MMAKRRRVKAQENGGKWYLKFCGFFISTPECRKILLKAKIEEEAINRSVALLNEHMRIFKKHGVMHLGKIVHYPHSAKLIHVSEDGIESESEHNFNTTIAEYGQIVKNDSVAA